MTDGILSAIESFTGYRSDGCPWRALFHPLVKRVVEAHAFYDEGNLSFAFPNPSHLLVEAVGFYHRVLNSVHVNHMIQDREKRDRERARG